MRKYATVRKKVVAAGNHVDAAVELEMQRFDEDAQKEKKIQERQEEIKSETNMLRRYFLQAKLFADNIS